jgi:hypothetical protein
MTPAGSLALATPRGGSRSGPAEPDPHEGWIRLRGVLLLVALGLPLAAAAADERGRLVQARQRVEAEFAAEEARCRERFAVAGCLAELRLRRREALAPLRERELELDEAERRERAAQRRRAVEAKQRALAARTADAASAPAPELRTRRAASAPQPGAELPPARSASESEARERAREAEAARRAAAGERRREQAEATRERIERRRAEREKSDRKPAPLPQPAASR